MAVTSAAATTPADEPIVVNRWRSNLAFIWIGVFVGLLGANFVFPFVPFYMQELGIEGTSGVAFWTALSASVTGLSLTLTAPIWGALADRYGRKPMFMRALLGAGILIGIMGVVTAAWQFVLLRFAMGAFAGTMGAAAALVAATTPRERVGYALGTLQTGLFTANMLGPVVGGLVASNLGIRESFFFCAALYLIAVVLVFFFVKETKPMPGTPIPGKKGSGSLLQNLRIVASDRQIILMMGLLFSLWLSTSFVRPVMPISIDEFADENAAAGGKQLVHLALFGWRLAFDEELGSGLVFAAVGMTSTIAALTIAPLGQRIGYRKCVAGAAAMTGLLFIPVSLAQNYTFFLLFMGATGLFQGAMVPGTNALIASAVPDGKQGSAFGLAASMQSLALLVGPLSGGAVGGLLGISWVYVVIGVILLIASGFASAFIREPSVLRNTKSPGG